MNLRYEIPQKAALVEKEIKHLTLPQKWFGQLDHIAIKTANPTHFDEIFKQLQSGVLLRPFNIQLKRIIRAEMQGRFIDVAELAGQLAVGSLSVSYLEVIQPREESIGKFKAGIDHFEYLSPIPLDAAERRLEQVFGMVPSREQKSRHDIISLDLGGFEVKLTDRPIIDVVQEELKEAEAEVVYENL